jgi:RNA polymerase sigma factor (sigma-70 family)
MAEFPSTHASLLVRLRDAQDGDAWREFVELYTPLVFGYARKQGLQNADAADLTQDVLGAVAGSVGRLEYDPERGTFRSWLFTIVRRKLSDWRAARHNRIRCNGDPVPPQFLEQSPAPERAEQEWEADWQRRVFAWACEQVRRDVSDATWQAFWRTAFQGESGKQVAAKLGLSVAAVYLARSRVLARLKGLVQSAQES